MDLHTLLIKRNSRAVKRVRPHNGNTWQGCHTGFVIVPKHLQTCNRAGNKISTFKTKEKMTPQEKAKELVDKFINADVVWEFTYGCAKQCALIAVDEIIQIVPTVYVTDDNEIHSGHRQYWQKVKQEIQKL